ncbi:MAG: transferase [Gallionella sp.]|nr:transferase [Gallionella sp.]
MQFKNKHVKNIARAMHQQFDQMLAWTADVTAKPCAGKPYLTEKGGILALNFDVMSVQSEMYIDRPDELVISYTRAMMSFLLLEPAPKRIAMIGLGGGSLAKYCYRYLPSSEIIVVEISPDVIALRNEFAIPADDTRFRVLLGNGAEWVTDTSLQPDVLIVDGFDTNGLPAQLSCQRFYDDCFASLADNGILVVNLWGGYPHYDEYLARIHTSFADRVVIVDAEDSVNKIVLAVKNSEFPPSSSAIRQHAGTLDTTHPLNFQAKSNKLIKALSGR